MRLILVRHGHAGRKADWHRPDKLRPLSQLGGREARQIVDVVSPLEPTRIISSPFIRCMSTAEPLASHMGRKVERSAALVPDTPVKAFRLVRKLTAPGADSGVVVVTHGEIMGDVLVRLAREDGVPLEHRPPGLKGCVWLLDFEDGKLAAARYIPPR